MFLCNNSIRWQRNSGKEVSAPTPGGLFLHPGTVTRQNPAIGIAIFGTLPALAGHSDGAADRTHAMIL